MENLNKSHKENIRLSSEGVWYHGDVEITHQRTVALFNKSIVVGDDGRFYLSGEKVPVLIKVDDTAFFVTGISYDKKGFVVTLSDGSEEPLDVVSLDIGKQNQLYCDVKAGKAKARFHRKVYYELMKHLQERAGYYGIVMKEKFYPVQSVAQARVYDELNQALFRAREPKKEPEPVVVKEKVLPKPVQKKTAKKVQKPLKKASKKPAKKPAKKVVKKSPLKKAVKKRLNKKSVKKQKTKKKLLKKVIQKKITRKKPSQKKSIKKKTVKKSKAKKK